MNRVWLEHAQRNRRSLDNWKLFAEHRDRVMEMVVEPHPAVEPKPAVTPHPAVTPRPAVEPKATPDGRSLCCLGAGNCNDIDLKVLLRHYTTIHLKDVDSESVLSGVHKQLGEIPPAVLIGPSTDVTGAMDQLIIAAASNCAVEMETWLQAAGAVVLELSGPFDVVVSNCLLSQLIDSLVLVLGENHPQFVSAVQTIRGRHIRLLGELTRPRGTAILIVDFVSSITAKELATAPPNDLAALAANWIRNRNFFTGTNPILLRHLCEQQLSEFRRIQSCELSPPWRWNLGPRYYAVAAITVKFAD